MLATITSQDKSGGTHTIIHLAMRPSRLFKKSVVMMYPPLGKDPEIPSLSIALPLSGKSLILIKMYRARKSSVLTLNRFIENMSNGKLLGAVYTRRYPCVEIRVWSDQENHEERESKDHAASTCGPHSDSFNDTSRRRRSNCLTNNFQTTCRTKS
ncbi:hypothetical protein TNCV_2800401 [Trichonephila clavipes]|nr:hypothetical protein TNCV_2800401 [Trichonephila clavipes]